MTNIYYIGHAFGDVFESIEQTIGSQGSSIIGMAAGRTDLSDTLMDEAEHIFINADTYQPQDLLYLIEKIKLYAEGKYIPKITIISSSPNMLERDTLVKLVDILGIGKFIYDRKTADIGYKQAKIYENIRQSVTTLLKG